MIDNAAVALLVPNLERHPDKIAYFCGAQSMTYRELDSACRRFAFGLQQRGIRPGERVLIVLPDVPAFPTAFLGSIMAGVVAIAAGTTLQETDVAYILKDSDARLLITHPALSAPRAAASGKVDEMLCEPEGGLAASGSEPPAGWQPYAPAAEDFAFMLYSSGSTGQPKGIPHRHPDLIAPSRRVGEKILGLSEQDVIFSASKLSFAYGLINSLVYPLFFGASAVLHPGKPDPAEILRIIKQHRPTVFFSVPTIYMQLILSCSADQMKFPMRICCSAGEALPESIFEEWRRLTGLELIDGIGSTEACCIYICNRPGRVRPGSTGQIVPGFSARIVDDDLNDVPPGVEGHLLIKGDTLAPFYWNLPEKSVTTMLTDGFVRTGDVFVEQDGYYYYRGRSDDMIKAGGQWISPVRVEDTLHRHPAVAECGVAAISVGGLVKPGAFVLLAPDVRQGAGLMRELRDHMLDLLPEYMCPARFIFVEDLPRTATGKVKRFELRKAI